MNKPRVMLFTAASITALLGAGCSSDASTSQSESPVVASYDALAAELAACAQDHTDCTTAAAGDTTAQAACEAALQTCQDSAKAELEQLKADLQACFSDAQDCVAAADAGSDVHACGQVLRECVKSSLPVPPCLAQLQSCVQGGGQPRDCGTQAHECIMGEIKAHVGAGAFSGFPGLPGADHDADDDGGCPGHEGLGGFAPFGGHH